MGWFLTFLLVVAIFNAEKLPELRAKLEEKIKDSVDAAKEGSKLASDKIKQVKTEIENKKNAAAAPEEPEENTPEEIAEELQVMTKYVPSESENAAEDGKPAQTETVAEQPMPDKAEKKEDKAESEDEDKPIDLENRY